MLFNIAFFIFINIVLVFMLGILHSTFHGKSGYLGETSLINIVSDKYASSTFSSLL